MKTLEHQLGDYGEQQRNLHGPISAEELTVRLNHLDVAGPVQPLHPAPTHAATFRPPNHWLAALGAAAVVLVVVGASALLFRATETDTSVTESASTPDRPAATAPLSVSFSSLSWSRVPYSKAAFGDYYERAIFGVTVGGPGLVAVGGVDTNSAVWNSVDGITWSRVPHDEAVFGGAQMTSVTEGGPGLVAVGLAWHPTNTGPDSAAAWTSVDGITWSRVSPGEAVIGDGATMWSVAVGGPGLVAVGWDGHPQGETSNAVVWTSVDGMTWSRVPDTDGVFSEERGQWMWSVTKGGPGLVAVGYDSSGAAVWTSPDGFKWSKANNNNKTIFEDAEMRGVTAGGPGLVAVGWDGHPQGEASIAVVWNSADGINWSRVPHNEAVFGGAYMNSVTAGGQGLVAVGASGILGTRQGQVWTSPDGIAWSRMPYNGAVFGGVEMKSVTARGAGVVAVGTATVWVAVPEE